MGKSGGFRICLIFIFVTAFAIELGFGNFEAVPYTVVRTFPQGIEERVYPTKKWAVIEDPDFAIHTRDAKRFASLSKFMEGANSGGHKLGITVPIATKITEKELPNNTLFEMGYFLPEANQLNPPSPMPEEDGSGVRIKFVDRGFRAVTITFTGTNTETEYDQKLNEMLVYLFNNNIEFDDPKRQGNTNDARQKDKTNHTGGRAINPPHYFVIYGPPTNEKSKNEVWIPL